MKHCILFMLLIFISGISAQSQDNEMLRKKIMEAYDAFNKSDYDKLNMYLTDDFIEHSPSPGQKAGLSGLIDMFKMMKTAYPDMLFTVNDVILDQSGKKAAVLFTFTGTNTGEMMGMPATNKKVNVMGIDWLLFNSDMKATEHWGYIDVDAMMRQLGMMGENK